MQKDTYLMICAGGEGDTNETAKLNFGQESTSKFKHIQYVGGEIIIENVKGIAKLMIKMVVSASKKQNKTEPKILVEKIDELAEIVKA